MFGEDGSSHVLSYTFNIKDSQARGFTRLSVALHKTLLYPYRPIHVAVLMTGCTVSLSPLSLQVQSDCGHDGPDLSDQLVAISGQTFQSPD